MNLYVKNNKFWFEIENLTRLFFPNEKINVYKSFDSLEAPFIFSELSDKIRVSVNINGFITDESAPFPENEEAYELVTVELIYKILRTYSGISQPWGLLTGVRPVKLYRNVSAEAGEAEAQRVFTEDYFVSPEKLALAVETEKNERKILDFSQRNSFSLYVGIPFCPSRCSYCSFVMSSVERAQKLIDPYVALLCEEIKATAQIADGLGLRLESVYFGGGTPTTLSAEQLDKVLKTVISSFDISSCRELTVEAGRPDTVTKEKLIALKENKVDRISINPQTTNPEVLKNIGRKHTVEQFFSAYELARECGFSNINTDLIAGLPGDTPRSFAQSLDSMLALDAGSITVHTLCMKRASNLTQEGTVLNREDAESARKMLEYSRNRLLKNGYIPYYLYRQSRMVGNLENVGWSKPGLESCYNVYVMDETHTILACGSGGVSKLKSFGENYLERVFNFKYPYEYINRFDEILRRKDAIKEFYSKYFIDY